MIADRRTIFVVERVTVRCNECPRQVSVFVGGGKLLGHALQDVGWYGIYEEDRQDAQHYCPEHAS